MSIGDRVQECIYKIEQDDKINAFIQLAIAIDATAKREYPDMGTSKRCKKFIRENIPFMMWSLTNGTTTKCQSFIFECSNGMTSFEDIIYKFLRCSLLHEGEMPGNVIFTNENYIAVKNEEMHFPIALIGSLLFAVIASPANKDQKISESSHFIFGKVKAYVNDMWGNQEKTKSYISNGFISYR